MDVLWVDGKAVSKASMKVDLMVDTMADLTAASKETVMADKRVDETVLDWAH